MEVNLNDIDEKNLVNGEIVLYRNDEGSKGFIENWDLLVKDYSISFNKISEITEIEEKKLKDYTSGNGYLTYNEIMFLTVAILEPFLSAIDAAKENYLSFKKVFEESKNDNFNSEV